VKEGVAEVRERCLYIRCLIEKNEASNDEKDKG